MKFFQLSSSSKYLLIRIRFLVIVLAIVLPLSTFRIVNFTKYGFSSLNLIFRNLSLSYDQKMRIQWGIFYEVVELVRENTPPTATIVHPPQVRPWLTAGNEALLQCFLYPRKLQRGYRNLVDKTVTHVLVARGNWTVKDDRMYGWPKFPVNVRKFVYLPRKRKILVDSLEVDFSSSPAGAKISRARSGSSPPILGNYRSHSEKKVNQHQAIKSGNRWIEYFDLTYTSSSYDYWMMPVGVLLTPGVIVKAGIAANLSHSVSLIAEVKYENKKLAIFSSAPNQKKGSWEDLLMRDLCERAKKYGLSRGWSTKKMELTKIGVNTGNPLEMPYIEKYGIIELERGQGEERIFNSMVDIASDFLTQGNFYRAKDQPHEAIINYRLAEKLAPGDGWIHCNLADMYRGLGNQIQAVAEYKRAIELEPNRAWFYFALGEVYRQQGEDELAIKNFQKALELDPSGVWAEVSLREIYQNQKETLPGYSRGI